MRFCTLFKPRGETYVSLHSPAPLSMRVLIAVFEAPEKTVELVPRMFWLTPPARARTGDECQFRMQGRAVRLCHRAKGDPHEGHLRPEMVSLVPPAPRRDIIRSQTRSVCFLSADRSRRSLHEVKAELHPSPQSGQECPDVADEVMLRIRKREAFLPILPGTGKTSDSPSPEHSGDRDGPARRLWPRSASGIPPRRRRPRPASSRTGAAS